MKIHNPSVTGSLVLSGSLTSTGTITTLGTLVAQTLVVQEITSSRDFVTGSTKFGSLLTNTHQFTGSVGITGSSAISVNGGAGFQPSTVDINGGLAVKGEINIANGSYVDPYSGVAYDLKMGGSGNAIATRGRVSFDNGKVQTDGSGNVLISGSVRITGSLDVNGTTRLNGNTTVTGSVNVSGSSVFNGTATIVSASLNYQQNLAVATGSFQTIVSAATGSFRSAFFDYVAFSGSIVRAGTVVSTWSGSNTEFYENFTGDLGGSTAVVTLQTAISASNIVLQAGISGSAWSVRSLVRLL